MHISLKLSAIISDFNNIGTDNGCSSPPPCDTNLAVYCAICGDASDGEAGDDVTLQLSPNSGSPLLPLAKVASGGELARAMLAVRRVLTEAPPTLVFDEVDAGVGGAAAHSVGSALAGIAGGHQVLVVTHLAQVAACADHHLVVAKDDDGLRAVTTVHGLDHEARVVELSRMLSGSPDSGTARDHAAELLAAAANRLPG